MFLIFFLERDMHQMRVDLFLDFGQSEEAIEFATKCVFSLKNHYFFQRKSNTHSLYIISL